MLKDAPHKLPVKMATQADMARLFAQPHQNYNQNMEQPSLRNIGNRVEWKSDNYGIEETTSIQTGRRGTGMEQDGLSPKVWWIKIRQGCLRSEEPQAQTRPPSPGFHVPGR